MSSYSRSPAEASDDRRRIIRWVLLSCVVTVAAVVIFVCIQRYRVHQHARSVHRISGPNTEWTRRTPIWLLRLPGSAIISAVVESPVSFSVGDDKPSDELINALLQELSGVESISIYNRVMPPGCFPIIASRHRPRYLDVSVPAITAEDARWLAQMRSLETLSLSVSQATYHQNDWSWMKSLPRLKTLHLNLGHATDEDVLALSEVDAVTFLKLHQATLSDRALERLARLPRLERLTLDGIGFRLHFAEGVRLPLTLQLCHLKSKQIDSRSLDCLIDLPKLQMLEVEGGSIDTAGFRLLSRLPALTQLWLCEVVVTDGDMAALASSQTLGEVLMDGTSGSPSGLAKLMGTSHWRDIRFGDVQFTRDMFQSRSPAIWEIEYELEHHDDDSMQERMRRVRLNHPLRPFPDLQTIPEFVPDASSASE